MRNIGYKRVSTTDQTTARQLDAAALAAKGITLDAVYEDKASGKDTNRPQLQAMLADLQPGDVIHVHSMDRIARHTRDLLNLVEDLQERGIGITFHKDNLALDPNSQDIRNNMLMGLLSVFAEFERGLIRERQRDGIAKARAKGVYKAQEMPEETAQLVRDLIAAGRNVKSACAEAGISRQAYYARIKRYGKF